jgi:hypothetical protein
MNKQELDVLKEMMKQNESRFASFRYTNKENETSLYLVHLNVNYLKILRRDLKVLEAINPSELNETEKVALDEVIASVRESIASALAGTVNSGYTKAGYYEYLTRGIKYNDEGQLYVNAFVVSKKVLVAGTYKKVNSSAKTIAKNGFRKMLKQSKFREFRIDLSQLQAIKMNGTTIEIA